MAKIRYGAVVGQASGSMGALTFAHNRNGQYVRARVKPTNPKSVKQQAVRSQLSTLAQAWRGLTATQRTGWTALGAQMTQTNSLGEATTLTGLQAYTSINQLRLTAGLSVVNSAPILDSAPTLQAAVLTALVATTGTLTLSYTGTGVAAQSVRIYATGPISAGRSFIRKSQYRLLTSVAASTTSPIDIKSAWTAVYGTIVNGGLAGGKISVLLVPVSANGIQGASSRADAIIA